MGEYKNYSEKEVLASKSGVFTVTWDDEVKTKLYPETNTLKTIAAVLLGFGRSMDTNFTGFITGPKLKRSFKIKVGWEEGTKNGKKYLEVITFQKSRGINGEKLISLIIPEVVKICEKLGYDEIQTVSLLPRDYMLRNNWKIVPPIWKKYGRYSIKVTDLKKLLNETKYLD